MEKDLFLPEETKREQGNEAPLALRMRPKTLEEFVGQEKILGPGKLLRRAIEADRISSLIFFGPPGTGKTALAEIIALRSQAHTIHLNAVTCGVAEIRQAILEAKRTGRKTILSIDEIHRFNKLQQEALLPDVEKGVVTLIGTTTENPYFIISGALISRSQVFEFLPLADKDIKAILIRALKDKERGLGKFNVQIEDNVLDYLVTCADGDGRQVLNALELAVLTTGLEEKKIKLSLEIIKESVQKKVFYDRKGNGHYDTISAFIKSMRGSDVDATLYWLAKMIYAGEDPRFIARRIIICASEDVGNADPHALVLASAAMQSVLFVGMPEAKIPLAQAAIYIATAPKSNASYAAINRALEDVQKEQTIPVAPHLKVASYPGAEKLGRGGYKYPFDYKEKIGQEYLGEKKHYYQPSDKGEEAKIKQRMKSP